MEDRTSRDPNKLPPVVRLLLDRTTRSFVTSKVVVSIWYVLGLVELFIIRGDGAWAFRHWNRDYAFFTRDDEVTKISPICAIEPVFQLLIKR